MNKTNLSSSLFNLADDPTKVAIWQEILNNEGIIAKEIKKNLYLKGTNIYYHLNQLEENELIISETHPVQGSNLLEKTYKINKNPYSEEEFASRQEMRSSFGTMKNVIRFRLFLNTSFFQQQTRRISNMDEEGVKEFLEKGDNIIPKVTYIQEKDLPPILEKMKELFDLLNEVRKDTDPMEYSKSTSHGVLLGCVPMKD